MCRLFAQLSPTVRDAKEFLVDSKFSILKQSNFKKTNLQKDGWGLGCFGNQGRVTVSKSPRPIYREKIKFVRLAKRVKSKVIIGHIRAASNPRGLPKRLLLNRANNQPFTDGRWLFAHNGTLEIPDEVSRRLGVLRRRVKSLNDSEIYFWHFIKHWRRFKSAPRALRACVEEIWRIWEDCRGRYPHKKTPYTSLNALVSNGRALHALCHTTRPSPSCGIFNPRQPWNVMSFSRRPGRLLIASENLDLSRWTRMRRSELLSARFKAGRLRLTREIFRCAPPRSHR